MSERKDGGAAFPDLRNEIYGTGERVYYNAGGMSLRDWFAGQALAGVLAGTRTWKSKKDAPVCTADGYASVAYRIADAMIAEREAGVENESKR